MSSMNTPGDRRRRFAKACDSCRRRKARCDGIRPTCTRCRGLGDPCNYADVNKPFSRQRRTHASNSRTLDTASPAAGPNPDLEHGIDRTGQPSSSSNLINTEISDTLSPDTVVGGIQDARYFGPSSGVSILSIDTAPQQRETPSSRSAQAPLKEGSWSQWTHPTLEKVFARPIHRSLPSWPEAFSLVREFFDEEHKALPCFHQPAFMILLGQQYSEVPLTDRPAWWVSLNAVLAIAQRRRLENSDPTAGSEVKAWEWAANGLATVVDIMMRNTQLLSVQALLCLAWFFLGTPNPQPSFMLVGSALRLAHSIGLHKSTCNPPQSTVERATRIKAFWIAFSLDQELCLRTGRPSAQDWSDFQVDIPQDVINDESDLITTKNGFKLNPFYATAQLSVVQGSIYRTLYSTEALGQRRDPSADVVQRLDSQLGEWNAAFSPALDETRLPLSGEHKAIIRLYYSYYNCVITIHRAHSRKYWMPIHRTHEADPSPSVQVSIDNCLQAARSVAKLLVLVPDRWKSFFWDVVPINSNAAVILCANVLRQPDCDDRDQDLRSVEAVINHFETLERGQGNTYLTQLRSKCQELFKMAQAVCRQPRTTRTDASRQATTTVLALKDPQRVDHASTVHADSSKSTTYNVNSSRVTEFEQQQPLVEDDTLQWWMQFGQMPFDTSLFPWSSDLLLGYPSEHSMNN